MTRTFPAFRKYWLVLAATVVLLAAALTAGTLFATNESARSRPLSVERAIAVGRN